MDLRVLIVDDEPEVSDLIARRLRMEAPHFKTQIVESGGECLEYLKTHRVDCILSDYQMPGMGGMDLLINLRTQGYTVPFIFITAQGNEDVAREAFKNGAYDYFTKESGFAHFARIANSVEQAVVRMTAEEERIRASAALENTEGSLRRAEARSNAVLAALPDMVFILDKDGVVIDVRCEDEKLLYVPREKAIGSRLRDVLPGEVAEEALKAIGRLLDTGEMQTIEYSLPMPGGPMYFEARMVAGGEADEVVGIVRDITARKRADESLRLFRSLLDRSNDAIFVNDPDTGRFLFVNDRACGNLGYEKSDLLAMRTLDIEEMFREQAAWDAHVDELRSKKHMVLEGVNRRRDGTTFPVEASVSYLTMGGKDYMVAVLRDITERKKAEQAVRLSEERMYEAQKLAHVGDWELDLGSKRLSWSDEVYRIYGREPGEFVPTFEAVMEAMHPDDLGPFLKAVEAMTSEGKPLDMDYRLIRPDGTERTVHTIGKASCDPSGRPIGESGTLQDITERKRMGEKLVESESFLSNMFKSIQDGISVIDMDFNIVRVNQTMERWYDYAMPIVGKKCHEVFRNLDRKCENCVSIGGFNRCAERVELPKLGRGGEITGLLECHNFPLFDKADKKQVGVIKYWRDITEQKRAEEALRDSEERFRALFESADDGIFLLDNFVFIDCNSRGVEMYGCKEKSEILGRNPLEFSPAVQPDGRGSAERFAETAAAILGGTPQKIYWRSQSRGGRPIDGDITLNRLSLKGKTYIQAVVRDITEKRKAEEAFIEGERFLSNMFASIQDEITVLDKDMNIVRVNPTVEKRYAGSMPLAGRKCYEAFLGRPDMCEGCPSQRALKTGEAAKAEMPAKGPSGEICAWVDIHAFPLVDSGTGKVKGVIEHVRDITDRKNLERQQADFYAMITHDIKSPLTAIRGYADMLLDRSDKLDADVKAMIHSVKSSGDCLYRLVDSFLSVSKMEAGKLKPDLFPADLDQILKKSYMDIEASFQEKGHAFSVETAADLPKTVIIDHKLVQRAVSNLLENARNYTQAGGRIALRVEKDGPMVVISVSDTGPGIRKDEREKVFEKYYRSPRVSGPKGTGLGLFIVKAVAEAHGGRVELQSEEGKGSTFSLFLPAKGMHSGTRPQAESRPPDS